MYLNECFLPLSDESWYDFHSKKMKTLITSISLVFLVCTGLFAEPSYINFPSDIDWQTRESDHFQIIYRNGSDAFAARTLTSAEKAYKILVPIFVEAPEKTWIVLADFQDSTNGYALNFPYSHIVVFASPPEATGQLAGLDDFTATRTLTPETFWNFSNFFLNLSGF